MNELKATRSKLKCLEMVEGTDLKWWEVVRYATANARPFVNVINFQFDISDYEFALGVVECKPVWKGDKLWSRFFNKWVIISDQLTDGYLKTNINEYSNVSIETLSWNQPKPKTLMVDLPIEYVEWCAASLNDRGLKDAFTKSLSNMLVMSKELS